MEIKITFSTIIGILMVVIVTIAAAAILSTLTKVSIEECVPVEYSAATTYYGVSCSSDPRFRCDTFTVGRIIISDQCLDAAKGLCCPTTGIYKTPKQNITIIDGKCCNRTKV